MIFGADNILYVMEDLSREEVTLSYKSLHQRSGVAEKTFNNALADAIDLGYVAGLSVQRTFGQTRFISASGGIHLGQEGATRLRILHDSRR